MYSWMSFKSVYSDSFKLFNKRNSICHPNDYYGAIWEYPWLCTL